MPLVGTDARPPRARRDSRAGDRRPPAMSCGPGDRRDPASAGVGADAATALRGPGAVVDVDVADPVGRRPAADDDRDARTGAGPAGSGSAPWSEMSMAPSLVASTEVALDALLIGARVRHEEDQLHRLLGQRVADPAQDPREEVDHRRAGRPVRGSRRRWSRSAASRGSWPPDSARTRGCELRPGRPRAPAGSRAESASHDPRRRRARDPSFTGDLLEGHGAIRLWCESALTVTRAF